MKLLILYPEPIKTARALTLKDLELQMKMYEIEHKREDIDDKYREWLSRSLSCFKRFTQERMDGAEWWSFNAKFFQPDFITEEFCKQQRDELIKKYPKKYANLNDNGDAGKAE